MPINIEPPCEEYSLVGQSSNMTEPRSALNEVFALIGINLNLLRKLNKSLVFGPKLAEPSFSPTPDFAIFSNSKTKECATSDVVDWLSVETSNVMRCA